MNTPSEQAFIDAAPELLLACKQAKHEMVKYGNQLNWPDTMPKGYAEAINALTQAINVVLDAPETPPQTEDVKVFGADTWVYCRQHMRVHQTGWCTVDTRDKIALGVKTAQEGMDKCREFGLELYSDKHK